MCHGLLDSLWWLLMWLAHAWEPARCTTGCKPLTRLTLHRVPDAADSRMEGVVAFGGSQEHKTSGAAVLEFSDWQYLLKS